MLMVKTKLKETKSKGIGLFADQNIAKDTIVWKNNKDLSFVKWNEKEWRNLKNKLTIESFKQINRYVYKYMKDNKYYLNLDDTRFINHSKNPNIIEGKLGDDIARRNIKSGEEITIDYETFYDQNYFKDLRKKYNF